MGDLKYCALVLALSIISIKGFSQTPKSYYDSLSIVLNQDEKFANCKYSIGHFRNGQLKYQGFFCFVNDGTSKYMFRPGITEKYYKNGRPKFMGDCSIDGFMQSGREYFKNGNLKYTRNYDIEIEPDISRLIPKVSRYPCQGWIATHYHRNGTKKEEGFFYQTMTNNDNRITLKHGAHYFYTRKEKLRWKVPYLHGEVQ